MTSFCASLRKPIWLPYVFLWHRGGYLLKKYIYTSLSTRVEAGNRLCTNSAERSSVIPHYDKLAAQYDSFYWYTREAFSELAVKRLEIVPSDRIADVGGGTGAVSELIARKVDIQSPVLVIDPSSKSLEIAKSRPGVETFLGGIEEFLQSNHASTYNKYLMFSAIQHFADQRRVFEQLHRSMPTGGQLLVIHHTDNSSLLLWKSALAKIQQALCSDTWTTLQYMKEAGFELEVDHFSLSWKMKKEHYFNGIRSRMFSFFEIFTDDEIEEGLKELSVKLPQEKEYTIEINDVFLIINAKIK